MPQATAESILRRAPVPDRLRADAWDAYEQATDADDLAARLGRLNIPDRVKADLWDLKAGQTPPAPPLDLKQIASHAQPLATIGDQLRAKEPRSARADLGYGIAAGVASTIQHGGDLIRRATGMERQIDTPEVQAAITPPDSPAGKLGFAGEQIGEFFLPGMQGTKMATAVPKAMALTAMQTGGDPVATGVSGALTAALPPVVGAAARASSALAEGARKSMVQALGATKEWAKAEAAKLAPQMLERGVKGSRAAMLEQAKAMAARAGEELNAGYQAAAEAGETVSGQVVRGYVQTVADALKVRNAAGELVTMPGTQRVVQQLDELDRFIGTLGDDIPVDKAAHVKRTWDTIVSKAGLFGPKATASATDAADAWALREASGAFRELINRNPTLAELNAESAFWTGLKKVLKETEKRTQAQASTGLVAAGTGGARGLVAGALSGDSPSDRAMKAMIGGLAGRQLVKVLQSPAWRTSVAGPLKQQLAEALASGNTGNVLSALVKVSAAMPSQVAR